MKFIKQCQKQQQKKANLVSAWVNFYKDKKINYRKNTLKTMKNHKPFHLVYASLTFNILQNCIWTKRKQI